MIYNGPRTLCLNATYEPLGFMPQNQAVVLFLKGKVDIEEEGQGVFRSPSGVYVPEPIVVRLHRFIKIPRSLKECISPRVLFARDNHTCQYCGVHQDELRGKNNKLTIDHIEPKAQGGPHHWENVVTACYKCNLRKGNRTPMQANMKFVDLYKHKSPRKPHLLVFCYGGRLNPLQTQYITSYYGVEGLNEDVEF